MTEQELLNLQKDGIFFIYKEVACPCCNACNLDPNVFYDLYYARVLAKIPFIMNSAYRCQNHNIEIGSTSDNHILGVAFDIKCVESWRRYIILHSLIKAGFSRFHLHKTFIHVDKHSNKGSVIAL